MKLSEKIQFKIITRILLLLLIRSFVVEDNVYGLERIFITYAMVVIITQSILNRWDISLQYSVCITLFLGFIDSRGVFSYYVYLYKKYIKLRPPHSYYHDGYKYVSTLDNPSYLEPFETVEPAGENSDKNIKSYSTSKTEKKDNTKLSDEDLNKILKEDNKQSKDENEHLAKAGGGLDQLKELIELAKKDSPYNAPKNLNDYTPAQAQRATYNLIDTVKQLKDTMEGMEPLMKTGQNLLELNKKMGSLQF